MVSNANPDPDPAFYLNADPEPDADPEDQTKADPDPGQNLKSQKVDFTCENT
jgi:hypothetical protein